MTDAKEIYGEKFDGLVNLIKSLWPRDCIIDNATLDALNQWFWKFSQDEMAKGLELAYNREPDKMPRGKQIINDFHNGKIHLAEEVADEKRSEESQSGTELPQNIEDFFKERFQRGQNFLAEVAYTAFKKSLPAHIWPTPSAEKFQTYLAAWAKKNGWDRHPRYHNAGFICLPGDDDLKIKAPPTEAQKLDAARWLIKMGWSQEKLEMVGLARHAEQVIRDDGINFGSPRNEAKREIGKRIVTEDTRNPSQDSDRIDLRNSDDKNTVQKIKMENRAIGVDSDEQELPPDYWEDLENQMACEPSFVF